MSAAEALIWIGGVWLALALLVFLAERRLAERQRRRRIRQAHDRWIERKKTH